MTVLEVIQRSAEYLAKKAVESPRLQAELLLAHRLGLPRMQLYLNFEREIAASELDDFRQMIRRRGQREPLQHIVGSMSFCGLELAVNRHVLVPRPETELLAERAWTFINQCASRSVRVQRLAEPAPATSAVFEPAPVSVIDFGTGSGCLAITLAAKCPTARLVALDISADALAVASANAARHGVQARIQFCLGNGFSALPRGAQFELMVSNPPYISTAEIDSLQPEVRDYDPRQALDGGKDGLDYFRLLAAEAGRYLTEDGRLMIEFGDDQAEPVRALFEAQKWVVEAIEPDYTQRPRILVARRA